MLLTIITFLIVLSILVFVHELGHFWTARRFGVKAEEFGFGYPPRAWGFYKNVDGKWRPVFGSKEVTDAADTIYSLNWIPIGGFVKIKGEDGDSQDPDSFGAKPIWQRAIMLLSGVTMNIILAVVLISVGFMIGLPQVLDDVKTGADISNRQIQIVDVLPDTPAAQAELKAGDIIQSVGNQAITNGDEMQAYVAGQIGNELVYKIKRGDSELEKKIAPITIKETGKGGIGIGIVETGVVRYPFFTALWEGFKATFVLTWAILVAFYELFRNLLTGHGLSAELGGPVKIAVLTGQVAQMGFIYVLQFTAMLSINLAIINAFPFPALDGGRALFLLIELIFRRPVKRELEGAIHYVGFILLMVLVVAVTYRDIASYSEKLKEFWLRLIS